jgi:hypothetical protein
MDEYEHENESRAEQSGTEQRRGKESKSRQMIK